MQLDLHVQADSVSARDAVAVTSAVRNAFSSWAICTGNIIKTHMQYAIFCEELSDGVWKM